MLYAVPTVVDYFADSVEIPQHGIEFVDAQNAKTAQEGVQRKLEERYRGELGKRVKVYTHSAVRIPQDLIDKCATPKPDKPTVTWAVAPNRMGEDPSNPLIGPPYDPRFPG